ncbi:phage major capsid protein [Dyadobacter sp. OTU695]|uniref:phage major capsid protein n=1 Tax=Dyadobacter sp. OTU695 TaxID=3043860 RepID=UPI00313E9201
MALTEAEIVKKVEDLGADLHKAIKGLEESIKENKSGLDKVKELEGQLETLKDNPDKIKGLSEQVEEVVMKLNTPNFGQQQVSKSFKDRLGEGLTEALKGESFTNQSAKASFKMDKIQEELSERSKAAGLMTTAVTLVDGGGNPISANPEYRQNPYLGPQRLVHFRDLVANSPMGSDIIFYPQWLSSEGDFAVQVNEGDTKAQLQEKFKMEQAVAYTIAGWYLVSKQNLKNIPWLQDSILSKGTERFYKAEDRYMFYGSGVNEIKGLKEVAPEFTGAMPNMYEAILNTVFDLLDKDYNPTGAVLRPLNYAELLKYKTTTGEYSFPMLFLPNQQFPMAIAGVPLVMSTAVNQNDLFVGDWAGDKIRMLTRESLNIEFSYEDVDNFRKNLVTIRLEAEEGLEIDEPLAFRYVDLANVATTI